MKLRTILTLGAIASIMAAISWWIGQQSYTWMPPQASAESLLIDDLFCFLTTIASFIVLGVVGTLTYSALFQQAGKYESGDGPHIEGNIPLEIVWTAIPFALVVWIATYSFQIYDQMGILGHGPGHGGMSAEATPLTAPIATSQPIEVLSRQWAWEFHYPEVNVSSTELHLPNNQRAHLVLTSEDVLHGFYIPAFRVKQDIIPGKTIDVEFTPIQEGRYRLRDSEYSGAYFAAMQTNVVVESPEAYQDWLTTAARQTARTAPNPAFDEYQQTTKQGFNAGWKSVTPAPAPEVNYADFDRIFEPTL